MGEVDRAFIVVEGIAWGKTRHWCSRLSVARQGKSCNQVWSRNLLRPKRNTELETASPMARSSVVSARVGSLGPLLHLQSVGVIRETGLLCWIME